MIANPVGIDKPIQELQQLFINNLWTNVQDEKKRFYARIFRNNKKGIVRPEAFTEIRNCYEEVTHEDSLSVLSWFDVAPATDTYNLGQTNHNVGIVFIVNLKHLYPGLSHRAVEESHLAVQKVVNMQKRDFLITGLTTGLEAYGDFNTDNLKHPDMQPWHVFRINCNVSYLLNCEL